MSLFSASVRTERVRVLRATTTARNAHGEAELVWTEAFWAWASVRFGSGAERRQAAQEGASQSATFGLAYSPWTKSIGVTDRLEYAGGVWDISAAVVEPGNAGVVLTAVRATGSAPAGPLPVGALLADSVETLPFAP